MKPIVDVSVIAANYNNAPFLEAFVDSVYASTVRPKEVIIVDDGSTDQSLSVLLRLQDAGGITLIALEHNVGFGNALNIGMERASGKYIMRLDPDDCITPDRIATQYEMLEADADLAVVGADAAYFSETTDTPIFVTNFPETHAEIVSRYKRGEHGVLHGTVMARACWFKRLRYRQACVPAEDYDLFARMLLEGARFKNVKRPLTYVRVHATSASNNLPFSTVEKTFGLRAELFHVSTPRIWVIANFVHARFYRQFLFERRLIVRLAYLAISVLFRPDKMMRRLMPDHGA